MQTFWSALWRSVVIALIYTIASALVGGLVMQGVVNTQASAANPTLQLATTALSGFLMAVVLGPTASLVHASRGRSIFIWTALVFGNMASVIIEGYFFAPGLLPGVLVPRVLALQALTSVVLAGSIAFFFPPSAQAVNKKVAIKRSPLSWTGRFMASAASYLFFYYFFGAINYLLVTGPYYESHPELAVPAAATVIKLASFRSLLIVLSILPLIISLHLPKRKLALLCGFLLFLVGGAVPLLSQTSAMPPVLLLASAVEIFFQNLLTGMVAALLLGRPTAATASRSTTPIVVARESAESVSGKSPASR